MKFTPTHEWIHVDGSLATIGITHTAQYEIGQIVHIELPPIGQLVKKGDPICILESTKSAIEIYTPASGRVVAVNSNLQKSTDAINNVPETDGWLYRLELFAPKELDALLSREQYDKMF